MVGQNELSNITVGFDIVKVVFRTEKVFFGKVEVKGLEERK